MQKRVSQLRGRVNVLKTEKTGEQASGVRSKIVEISDLNVEQAVRLITTLGVAADYGGAKRVSRLARPPNRPFGDFGRGLTTD